MPETIDWPPPRSRRSRRIPLLLLLAFILFVLFGSRTTLSYYVESLWFGSLGYGDVFWKTLRLQSAVFTLFTGATFLILYGIFLALKRAYFTEIESGSMIFIGG